MCTLFVQKGAREVQYLCIDTLEGCPGR